MYKTLDDEFLGELAPTQQVSERELDLTTNQEREAFAAALLGRFLGEKKLKELDSITDRIKYKHHLIELSTKELRKEKAAKKRPQSASTTKQHNNGGGDAATRRRLSKRLRKQLGMGKIDKSEKLDYKEYEKLNEAWLAYASSCLLTCLATKKSSANETSLELSEESVLNVVKQMDFHGCKLTVTSSNAKTLIGLHGIVLQDKRNVFVMLTLGNEVKIVPKWGNLFELDVFGGACRLTLVGSNLVCKPEMRVTKHAKIKTKENLF